MNTIVTFDTDVKYLSPKKIVLKLFFVVNMLIYVLMFLVGKDALRSRVAGGAHSRASVASFLLGIILIAAEARTARRIEAGREWRERKMRWGGPLIMSRGSVLFLALDAGAGGWLGARVSLFSGA